MTGLPEKTGPPPPKDEGDTLGPVGNLADSLVQGLFSATSGRQTFSEVAKEAFNSASRYLVPNFSIFDKEQSVDSKLSPEKLNELIKKHVEQMTPEDRTFWREHYGFGKNADDKTIQKTLEKRLPEDLTLLAEHERKQRELVTQYLELNPTANAKEIEERAQKRNLLDKEEPAENANGALRLARDTAERLINWAGSKDKTMGAVSKEVLGDALGTILPYVLPKVEQLMGSDQAELMKEAEQTAKNLLLEPKGEDPRKFWQKTLDLPEKTSNQAIQDALRKRLSEGPTARAASEDQRHQWLDKLELPKTANNEEIQEALKMQLSEYELQKTLHEHALNLWRENIKLSLTQPDSNAQKENFTDGDLKDENMERTLTKLIARQLRQAAGGSP